MSKTDSNVETYDREDSAEIRDALQSALSKALVGKTVGDVMVEPKEPEDTAFQANLLEAQAAYYRAVAAGRQTGKTEMTNDEMLKLVLRPSGQKRVLTLSDAVGKFNKVQKRRAKNKSARASRKRNR